MTFVKISGIKLVRANGSIYRYHRATGKRIHADPDKDLEAFVLEIKALEAEVASRAAPPNPPPAGLGGLFALYKTSPEYLQLEAPRPQRPKRIYHRQLATPQRRSSR